MKGRVSSIHNCSLLLIPLFHSVKQARENINTYERARNLCDYMHTCLSPYTIIAEMMTMITRTRPSKTPPTIPPVRVSERLLDVSGAEFKFCAQRTEIDYQIEHNAALYLQDL